MFLLEALPKPDVVLLGQDRFVQLRRLLFREAFYLDERLAQSHTSQKCLDEEGPRGHKRLQSTNNLTGMMPNYANIRETCSACKPQPSPTVQELRL